ncbi:IclR family transcriptional regulator [uncultured Jatrophihabitans sp.]|uniref:IclR family transcriptional regulator n=1 Tax=uncultured Jatrophihabitans sp. TaxID=1610747 RepID=UPI0035CBBDE2
MAEPDVGVTTAAADIAAAGDPGRMGALRNGLAVFDMFDVNRQTVTATEIARFLGVHKSTASRIASNLVLSGYLVPGFNGSGFRLSGKFARLGSIATLDANLATVATDYVNALVDDVGETCHLGVLEGDEAVTVVLVNGSYAMRMHSFVGKRNAAHTTAMGKALLAGLSEQTLDMLFPKKKLSQHTTHTVGTLTDLKDQLAIIRKHGFALDNEELEPGLRCVAAPIADHDGNVVAALTIAGASSRLTIGKIDFYVAKVKGTADAISDALGAPADWSYNTA